MARNVNTIYLQKATRLSLYRVSDKVGEVFYGQHFHLNDDQEWEYADGTRKSYPTLNQRYAGPGFGVQLERLEGRDDVTRNGHLSVLVGNFEMSTSSYDKNEVYEYGAPLAIDAGGIIVPFDAGKHEVPFIVGYVTGVPEDDSDELRYQG